MDKGRPSVVNILGRKYAIIYLDKPSEVDHAGRQSLWGQIDYWTRTIRVYDGGRTIEDIWQTIFHEALHAISSDLNLSLNDESNHDDLDMLSIALVDMLFRNGWMREAEASE